MQKNPYSVLGLGEDASKEQVQERYSELKKKYSEDRFLEGEAGNTAAKNLTELEIAYQDIMDSFKKTADSSQLLDEVEDLIRAQDYIKAQEKLYEITDKNARWHYLQSVVYYKKNWLNESKKQLEIALKMEPGNAKYQESFASLEQKININNQQAFTSGNANNYGQDRQMGGDQMANCCTALLCANCLTSCCCR